MFITFVRWRLSVGIKRFTYLLTYVGKVFMQTFAEGIFFGESYHQQWRRNEFESGRAPPLFLL